MRLHPLLKRCHHWTVYTVLLLALSSVTFLIWRHWADQQLIRFESAIMEAGGVVYYDFNPATAIDLGGEETRFYLTPLPAKPIGVEIVMGSHPIPGEIAQIAKRPSIESLALKTHQADDHLLPTIITFKNLKELDLRGSSFSGEAIVKISKALPGLKKFEFDPDALTEHQAQTLEE